MEKLYDLVNNRQDVIDSLETKRNELRNEMSNPRLINENAEQIKNAERVVSVLCDAIELAEELSPGTSAKEILKEVKSHLEEMKDEENNEKSSEFEKDIKIVEDIISKDLNESDINTSKESIIPGSSYIEGEEMKGQEVEDEDISDSSNFDDF